MLSGAEEQELIRALAALALEDPALEKLDARDELAVFQDTADDYFRDPEAALSTEQREEDVGFGLELGLLTPYLLAIATYVIRKLAALVEQSVGDELKPSIAKLVHKLFRQPEPTAPEPGGPPPLTPDQARGLRDAAYECGIQLGLPKQQAELLAHSVVGRLVTG